MKAGQDVSAVEGDRPLKERSLEWTVWPAAERPGWVVAVLVVVLVTAVFAGQVMQSIWAGVLAGGFLVYALRGFFFPTVYRIDAAGVTTRCLAHTAHLPWRRLRRVAHDARGAFLSRRVRGGLLDRLSGMPLTWNGNRHEAVRLIAAFRSDADAQREKSRFSEAAACGTG